MNKDLKVALAIIAVALVICLGASVGVFLAARQFVIPTYTTDPAQAARLGHQIADYSLPPGYHEIHATGGNGFKMAIIGKGEAITNSMTITLMELSGWMDMGRESFSGEPGLLDEEELDLGTVSTRTVTIRGRPVTLQMTESDEQEAAGYRQVWCAFPGRFGSTVMIMAGGSREAWDQQAIDAFLASIK
jgi:hypothetical protein